MPRIKIERVISVSSEDKLHVVENILNTDSNKKWKCKTAGEQNCTVILQLAELTVITGIDIGNEHSAFVEVHVGRTGFNDADYKVLLMMSSFMTPLDSRQSENVNRIRMFKTEDFCKPVCEERWDRVKLICTQPFNRHVQYGLSFITLHSAISASTSEIKLGKFKINTESTSDTIKPGSIFNKVKTGDVSLNSASISAAAEIRKASLPSQISKNESLLTVKNDKIKKQTNSSSLSTPSSSQLTPKIVNRNRNDILYNDEDNEPSKKVDKVMKNYHDKKKVNGTIIKDKLNQKDLNVNNTTTPSTSKQSLNNSSNKKRRSSPKPEVDIPVKKVKKVKTKPFRQLFQGVIFVMSGYQNPQRANLRDMAIKMGAKYKPDWNNECTHLICAFKNTPKYNEVRGRGKIVKCDWITECYNQRKRIPWRRFALDNREQIQSDSEEEILDELLDDDDDKNALSTSNKKRYVVSSDSDTEDEIERIQAAQKLEDNVNSNKQLEDEELCRLEIETDEHEEKNLNEDDIYNNDTDIEDEILNSEDVELKPLPDLFLNMKFIIANNLADNVISELKRYIYAYGGNISDKIEDADYFITEDDEFKNNLIKDNAHIKSVRPAWIWECNDEKELINVEHFLL